MASVRFETAAYVGAELGAGELPELQAFFDANPAYFQQVNGLPPRADEAREEFEELPPAHMAHGERWFLGVRDRARALAAMANVTAHLVVPGVWHLGLYIVATRLHGQGAAAEIYAGLEASIRATGADWMRLGVVRGNLRAERFWARQGYVETRVREGVDTGGRVNDIRVLLKPLGTEPLEAYLERVPRDQPGSLLA